MNKSESKYFNTAKKFNEALILLLEKKDFEYITVSEICDKAEKNRSTFYLHYENTYDLLEETIRNLLDDFILHFNLDLQSITHKFKDCDLKDLNFINTKYLYPYLSYIKENKRIFSAVLSQPKTFKFDDIYKRMFDNIFNPILNRFDYPKEHQKYVMMFYLNGITAIISQWLADDCDKSIEEIAIIIQNCIFGKDVMIKID